MYLNKVFIFLSDYCAVDEMDAKDEDLRHVILKVWPIQAKKMLNLLVPPQEGLLTILSRSTNITSVNNLLSIVIKFAINFCHNNQILINL